MSRNTFQLMIRNMRKPEESLKKAVPRRREGAIAIRIRKLCKEINEQGQLDQEQRIVVVIQVLEFCKSGGQEVSQLELGFISTLAEGLNIISRRI
ncbi:MAG: hypothetical protein MZV63_38170 [Marinilabiliales bacterium]|nr:hypothetical protein [Marinilabiliales bacterium]